MNNKHYTLIQSFGFAMQGIKTAIRLNRNLKIHLIFGFFVIIFSFILSLSAAEKALVFMMILLVMVAEMLNTAIEEIVNLVAKDYREEAKYAKDVSAGMVLVVAIGSVIVGLYIFLPHFLAFLNLH